MQSFQMKGLQDEFKKIDDDLKVSLKQRMKFEIAERIIADSRSFFHFRLYMIQQYQIEKAYLLQYKPSSTKLIHMTPANLALDFKRLAFELLNGLDIDHHEPGQKVIKQNDPILDKDDEMDMNAKVFFIMTGTYQVQSLVFLQAKKRNKLQKNEEPSNDEES